MNKFFESCLVHTKTERINIPKYLLYDSELIKDYLEEYDEIDWTEWNLNEFFNVIYHYRIKRNFFYQYYDKTYSFNMLYNIEHYIIQKNVNIYELIEFFHKFDFKNYYFLTILNYYFQNIYPNIDLNIWKYFDFWHVHIINFNLISFGMTFEYNYFHHNFRIDIKTYFENILKIDWKNNLDKIFFKNLNLFVYFLIEMNIEYDDSIIKLIQNNNFYIYYIWSNENHIEIKNIRYYQLDFQNIFDDIENFYENLDDSLFYTHFVCDDFDYSSDIFSLNIFNENIKIFLKKLTSTQKINDLIEFIDSDFVQALTNK